MAKTPPRVNWKLLFDLPEKDFRAEWARLFEGRSQDELQTLLNQAIFFLAQEQKEAEETVARVSTAKSREEMERIAMQCGIQPHRLREWGKVAQAFPPERRNPDVPFHVYECVADEPRIVQDLLIDEYLRTGELPEIPKRYGGR